MRPPRARMAMIGVKAPCISMATRSMKATTTTTPAPSANRVSLTAPFSSMHRSHRFTGHRSPDSWVHRTEPAHPALVLDDRLVEVLAPPVGPQHLGEDQLAVGDLPE